MFPPALRQPLLASGDYGSLKEFSAPRTFDFTRYGIDAGTVTQAGGRYTIDPSGDGSGQTFSIPNRDFNVRELRGNAVLRWEYRPGSTLYLVWQQARSEEIEASGGGPAVASTSVAI
jgi:hypothetical protein